CGNIYARVVKLPYFPRHHHRVTFLPWLRPSCKVCCRPHPEPLLTLIARSLHKPIVLVEGARLLSMLRISAGRFVGRLVGLKNAKSQILSLLGADEDANWCRRLHSSPSIWTTRLRQAVESSAVRLRKTILE